MGILTDITAGDPRKLVKPVFFTVLSDLLNIVPVVLVIAAVGMIFEPFIHPGAPMNIAGLWWVSAALLLFMIVIFLGEVGAYRASYRGAYAVAAEGRADLAEHLRRLPLGYLTRRDPGDLANMMMGDFTQIEQSLSHNLPQLIGALILPIFALVGLAFLDWRMAVAMFIALPMAVLIVLASSGVQRSLGSRHIRAKINAASRLQEYLNGIRVIKAYNLSGSRFVRLEKSFRELMRESIRIEGLLGPVVLLAVASVRVGLTVLVLVGVYLLLGGTLDILTFVIFLVIGSRVFDPLTMALINFPELRYHALAGERILALRREPIMQGQQHPPEKHDIEFASVTFGYGSDAVLHDVSLKMPEGSMTALVGPSGSGKSTILKLVARFYDPQSGRIVFGGEDIRNMDPEALLERISMVFQDVYLFKDTIGNNIRFGREGATFAEVEGAARKACCHEFIMKLPMGYDTPVGEGGSTLSGGQKQRISIARVFLKNPPILILDEATSSLDNETELKIQASLEMLSRGRTSLVIAHRLSTIKNADEIVVITADGIIERGNHSELLKLSGHYARLYKAQFKGYIPDM